MSERLDIVLMARHHDFSRSRIKGLIEAGFVKVNGEVVTKAGAMRKYMPSVRWSTGITV